VGSGTKQAGEYTFFYGKGNGGTMNREQFFLYVKRVEFVSDRMSYIILRGHWFHIIVVKDSLHEELECMFHRFHKYHMKILLGDLSAKVGRRLFKLTIGNESLHEISNDNGVIVVNLAASKNLIVKSTCFYIATFINVLALLHMGNPIITMKS
jgi:hypothetical protein